MVGQWRGVMDISGWGLGLLFEPVQPISAAEDLVALFLEMQPEFGFVILGRRLAEILLLELTR